MDPISESQNEPQEVPMHLSEIADIQESQPENLDGVGVDVIDAQEQKADEPQNSEQPKEEEKPPEPEKLVTCPICICETGLSGVSTLSCTHIFCKECLNQYLLRQMDEFNVLRIKCPQDKCTSEITDVEIRTILSPENNTKFLSLKQLKKESQNFAKRFCPKPGCTKSFYPKDMGENIQCECGAQICHVCFKLKHNGKTCLENMAGEMELLSNNTDLKMCLICKTWTEKKVGCPHITCPVCDFRWCWDCGKEWSPNHFSSCTKIWSPEAPQVFQQEKRSCWTTTCTCLTNFLYVFGMALMVVLTVLLIFPCIVSGEISKSMQNTIKNGCLRGLLALFFSILMWPLAVILAPFLYVQEQYGFCVKKRWKAGVAGNFGMKKGRQPSLTNQQEVPPPKTDDKNKKVDIVIMEDHNPMKMPTQDFEMVPNLEIVVHQKNTSTGI